MKLAYIPAKLEVIADDNNTACTITVYPINEFLDNEYPNYESANDLSINGHLPQYVYVLDDNDECPYLGLFLDNGAYAIIGAKSDHICATVDEIIEYFLTTI